MKERSKEQLNQEAQGVSEGLEDTGRTTPLTPHVKCATWWCCVQNGDNEGELNWLLEHPLFCLKESWCRRVITDACQSRISNSRVMGSWKSGMQKWLASPWFNWPYYISWNISRKMMSKTGPLVFGLAPGSTFFLIGTPFPETHQAEYGEKLYFSLALPKQHMAPSFLQLPKPQTWEVASISSFQTPLA